MRRSHPRSISWRLTWMNMLVSGFALLIAGAAFAAYDVATFRDELVRNVSTQAQIVASNSVSSVLFNDPKTAQQTLAALEASPDIVLAQIYTNEGQLFASYSRTGVESISPGGSSSRARPPASYAFRPIFRICTTVCGTMR